MTNSESKIVVLGSVNIDLMTRLPRLPTPGETVTGGHFTVGMGGKGGNQAAAVARLGITPYLVAAVGDDQYGRDALDCLRRDGVNTDWVRAVDQPTGTATILVDAEGENVIALAAGANASLNVEEAQAAAAGLLRPGDILVMNLEVPLAAVWAAARVAVENGAQVILDPAPAQPLPPALLGCLTYLTPNEHELELLVDETSAAKAAAHILATGSRAVIVTKGAQGVDLYTHDGAPVALAAMKVEPVDTTGAGDAFTATVAVALAHRLPLTAAVMAGMAAGAYATTAVGARGAQPTRSELAAFAGFDPLATTPVAVTPDNQ
jgi:ribokinase